MHDTQKDIRVYDVEIRWKKKKKKKKKNLLLVSD